MFQVEQELRYEKNEWKHKDPSWKKNYTIHGRIKDYFTHTQKKEITQHGP